MSKRPVRLLIYENTIELILCCSSAAGHGACPQVWLIYPVRRHWRKLILPCKQLSLEDSFLIRVGSPCPPLGAGTPSGCNLCMLPLSPWVHRSVSPAASALALYSCCLCQRCVHCISHLFIYIQGLTVQPGLAWNLLYSQSSLRAHDPLPLCL